jgi:NAD(P)-dependent dehydrogenase (short-subunit alcohol dehydrogenase family)
MCCRNEKKAAEAKEDVIQRAATDSSKVHTVQLDLSDLDNVGTFRQRYDATPGLAHQPIHMLILNAGIMGLPKRELTKQGVEMQMGTNMIGHFKFTAVMYDLCKAADHCRIVAVSSLTHLFASKINIDDFNRDKSYDAGSVYGESKLAEFVFIVKLNRLLEEKGVNNIIAVACHP